MNWKLIFLLSLISIAMAIAEVFGLPQMLDRIFWPLILIFDAFMIARSTTEKRFLNGFMVCIFNCVWITLIHAAMFDTFAKDNPDVMSSFRNPAMDPHTMMFLVVPMIGIITGLITGTITWIMGKFIKPQTQAA